MGMLVRTIWESDKYITPTDTLDQCTICKKRVPIRDLHQCIYNRAVAFICHDCMQSEFLIACIV